jgi:glycosyltransferase involved in cell wall biosynthesis
MLVSIITATRNASDTIADTLLSVASQTNVNIEHIIVDGASTDGTVEVVRRIGTHVAQIISEPDTGIYDAFNKGLAVATGDVIGFLNAGDTYLSTESVATVQSTFLQSPVDAVFGDLWIVDRVNHAKITRRFSSRRFTPRKLRYGFMPAHPTLFMRRQIYILLGGYRADYLVAGDFELCVRAFLKCQCSYQYIPQPLVRMLRGGVSNQGWKSIVTNTREMLRACISNGVRSSSCRLASRIPIKLWEVVEARLWPGMRTGGTLRKL